MNNHAVKRKKDTPIPAVRARVMIVDDHPLLRGGVAALLEASPDLQLCGEAASAAEALQAVAAQRPDAVIVDISIPGGGMELIRQIRALYPKLALLVYSMHDENLYAERTLRAGALGYLMKQEPPERVLDGIRTVLRGDVFVSDNLRKNLLSNLLVFGRRPDARQGVERLSDRELQVFESLGRGRTTLEIAEDLHLSPKTVETYRSNIKRKLGLENGHQLIHAAVRWVEQSVMSAPAPAN